MSSEKRSATSARGLRRGDALAVDMSLQAGNLVRLKDPKMLTLVGKPANQVGFKTLRSDQGETPMSNPVVRRTRRSTEMSPILRLAFPADTDEAAVTEAMKTYGLSGYTIAQQDGVFIALRSDLQSISESTTMEIKLNDAGLTATVARQSAEASNPGDKPALKMVSIEFDSTKFTKEEVKRWAEEKSVDGLVQDPQNEGDCYVVRRSETSENEETRRMTLEDGVTAVIVRDDSEDVPSGYVAVVNETAYGNWGWGQLDFMAAMADTEFSEHMREALYKLEEVLRNIVIYSALPLDVRKDLANRALAQYGEYIGTVLDSLPRQLLVSVTRSATPTKEIVMKQENSGAAPTPAPAEVKTTVAPATPETMLTRADVEAMIAAAVAAAVAVKPAEVAPAEPVAPAPSLTRADLTAAFAEVVKPITERLEKIEGETVIRPAPAAEAVKKEEVKDVFRGAIPGIKGRGK